MTQLSSPNIHVLVWFKTYLSRIIDIESYRPTWWTPSKIVPIAWVRVWIFHISIADTNLTSTITCHYNRHMWLYMVSLLKYSGFINIRWKPNIEASWVQVNFKFKCLTYMYHSFVTIFFKFEYEDWLNHEIKY